MIIDSSWQEESEPFKWSESLLVFTYLFISSVIFVRNLCNNFEFETVTESWKDELTPVKQQGPGFFLIVAEILGYWWTFCLLEIIIRTCTDFDNELNKFSLEANDL